MRWTLALAVLVVTPCAAQQLTILEPERVTQITEEISGDAAYEHVRYLTRFHRPGGGADGLWQAATYVEEQARSFGLEDVTLIRQDYGRVPWNARFADLWVVGDEPRRIASTIQTPLHLADYSRSADVTAELVDVGSGTSEEDYRAIDVADKVVLAHGSAGAVMREAVWQRGAAGIVVFPDPSSVGSLTYQDQIRWSRVPVFGDDNVEPTFAFVLSLREGMKLRRALASATEPVRVHAVVDAGLTSMAGDEPWQVMVEGYIRGTEPGLEQDIVLTGHLQEEKTSANDDASGVASLLEIGRALSRLIDEGRLPRPRRDIRFWWVTEISSQRQYFADHPEAHHGMWVNINNDMVAANQAQDVMRVQNITRVPATRFHFFNDVVEAVVDYMVATNSSELAEAQAGSLRDVYPKPHFAHLGTRHRYNAKTIFFHSSSDHMTFNEAPIGVPGVSFTNWPDNYIHTSDDDLWNVDATQLGRNAAATALMAYTMAAAGDDEAAALTANTAARGAVRMARNLGLALQWLAASPRDPETYRRALAQVRYAAQRERLGVASLAGISSLGAAMADAFMPIVEERERAAVAEVEAAFASQGGVPGDAPASSSLQALERIRPRLAAGPAEFLDGRGGIGFVRGLHGLMASEVLSAVDGQRTGRDIYAFVAAEAREAGAHYYGVVTPEAVHEYLANAREAGLVTY